MARQKSRFAHDYFYIRDEVLGPFVMRVATFFPFQTTYYLNGHNFYRLNQLRYDLRKLKGTTCSSGTDLTTTKGVEVDLLFFFHKRLCGPLANSRIHHQADAQHRPDSRLDAAYHRADAAIQKAVNLLAAA